MLRRRTPERTQFIAMWRISSPRCRLFGPAFSDSAFMVHATSNVRPAGAGGGRQCGGQKAAIMSSGASIPFSPPQTPIPHPPPKPMTTIDNSRTGIGHRLYYKCLLQCGIVSVSPPKITLLKLLGPGQSLCDTGQSNAGSNPLLWGIVFGSANSTRALGGSGSWRCLTFNSHSLDIRDYTMNGSSDLRKRTDPSEDKYLH